jgi:hypothetical protein
MSPTRTISLRPLDALAPHSFCLGDIDERFWLAPSRSPAVPSTSSYPRSPNLNMPCFLLRGDFAPLRSSSPSTTLFLHLHAQLPVPAYPHTRTIFYPQAALLTPATQCHALPRFLATVPCLSAIAIASSQYSDLEKKRKEGCPWLSRFPFRLFRTLVPEVLKHNQAQGSGKGRETSNEHESDAER